MLEDVYKEIVKTRCEKMGKVCYSEKDAMNTIRLSKSRKNRGAHRRIPLRAYRCDYCGCIHLTSQKTQMSKRGKWNG